MYVKLRILAKDNNSIQETKHNCLYFLFSPQLKHLSETGAHVLFQKKSHRYVKFSANGLNIPLDSEFYGHRSMSLQTSTGP